MIKTYLKKIIYFLISDLNIIRKLQWPLICNYLFLKNDDKVLDFGAGNLRFTKKIVKKSMNVYAYDICFNENDIEEALRHSIYVLNDSDLNNFKNYFDKILLSSVIQMVSDPGLILSTCNTLLKNDGVIIISCPVGFKYLEEKYETHIMKYIIKYFSLPKTFPEFLNKLNLIYGVSDKSNGYYSIFELYMILKNNNLKIIDYEYTPRGLASKFWQIVILINYITKFRFYNYMILIYPIFKIINFINFSNGYESEVIIKAQKFE